MGSSIRITRCNNLWVDRLRAYRIMLDGQQAGSIRRGETVALAASPGRHELYLRIDWTRSRKIDLELADGETRSMSCCSSANPFTGLSMVTIGRARYIDVKLADSSSPAAT